MAREIITIQIGQCGNRLGNTFWRTLFGEHNISENGEYLGDSESPNGLIHTFFDETESMKFKARCICLDSDSDSIETLRSSPNVGIYKSENMIHSNNEDALSCWEYTDSELYQNARDSIWKEIESTDALQGFQFIHSISGKHAGSPLTSHLMNKIKDELYPKYTHLSHSVFPSNQSDGQPSSPLDPYQSVLCLHQLLENCDLSIMYHNQALERIVHRLKRSDATYSELNWIASMAMAGVTS